MSRQIVNYLLDRQHVITSYTIAGAVSLVFGQPASASERRIASPVLRIDGGVASRNVTLPPVAQADGLPLWIHNVGSSNTIVLLDASATTIATIAAGGLALVQSDGVAWRNESTQTTSFAAGLSTDTISERTSTSGVTVDGLLIKDGAIREGAIVDPGNAGAISVAKSGVCSLVSAGAETRTLAIPTFVGQRIVLVADTHAGNIVVTAAAPINVANNTIMTFNNVSDAIELVAVTLAAALVWQVGWNDGVALS